MHGKTIGDAADFRFADATFDPLACLLPLLQQGGCAFDARGCFRLHGDRVRQIPFEFRGCAFGRRDRILRLCQCQNRRHLPPQTMLLFTFMVCLPLQTIPLFP